MKCLWYRLIGACSVGLILIYKFHLETCIGGSIRRNTVGGKQLILIYLYLVFSFTWNRVSEWLVFNANSAIFQLYHSKWSLILKVLFEVITYINQSGHTRSARNFVVTEKKIMQMTNLLWNSFEMNVYWHSTCIFL
jgi:hypothetical protein